MLYHKLYICGILTKDSREVFPTRNKICLICRTSRFFSSYITKMFKKYDNTYLTLSGNNNKNNDKCERIYIHIYI